MSESEPLPSVERPEHDVQLPLESTPPEILSHGSEEGVATISRPSRDQTPIFHRLTEQYQLQEDKDNAFHLRQDLRELVLKTGMIHDLGGELDESSTDSHYWVERGHFFAKEKIKAVFALKGACLNAASGGIRTNSWQLWEKPESPLVTLKKFAYECWEEFHNEARRVGLNLLSPSELDETSCDPDYWGAEYVFYFNEIQRVKDLVPKRLCLYSTISQFHTVMATDAQRRKQSKRMLGFPLLHRESLVVLKKNALPITRRSL